MYNRAVLARWREDGFMPSLDERVAYLEGRFGEHMQTTDALRDDIGLLRGDMNRRFEDLQSDMNRRFEQVDKRFERVDKRFDSIDARFDRTDSRLDSMDAKIERHFTWLVGLQMGGLIAVFSALIGLYFR